MRSLQHRLPCSFVFCSFLISMIAGCSAVPSQSDEDKTIVLFNGQSLDLWESTEGAVWFNEQGILKPDTSAGTGMLYTKNTYSDYKLTLEFKPGPEVNSGVFVQCSDVSDITANSCYEVNIWDNHPRQEFRTGAVVARVFPPLAHVNTVDRWNQYEIVVKGSSLKAWVNGELTAELNNGELSAGHIALQWFGPGPIEFRNIHLKPGK